MKLVSKLLVVVGITSAVSVGLLSFVTFRSTRSAVVESIKGQQRQLAKQTMEKIDRFLYERLNNIQAIAEDEEFEGFLVGKDFSDPKETLESSTKLRELSLFTGPWNTLSLVNTEGDVMLTVGGGHRVGDNLKADFDHEANFASVLQGEVHFSDAFIDDENGKPTMIFAAPIRNESDPNQPVVGAVIGHLGWPVITELVSSVDNAVVDLYNRGGFVIANNDAPEDVFVVNNSVETIIHDALMGKEGSVVGVGIDQKETVSSVVIEDGFLDYTGNKWVLLIEQPSSLAFVPAIRSAQANTLFLAPIFILGNAIILVFIIGLLRPIKRLTQNTKEIAAGNFSKRVSITSQDEFGQLGGAFNDMAGKLQEVNKGLADKIKEKTKELREKVQDLEKAKGAMLNMLEDLNVEKQRVEQEKAKDEAILTSIGDGMIITDNKARILRINTVGAKMLEVIDPETVQSKAFAEAFAFWGKEEKRVSHELIPVYITLQTQQPAEEMFSYHLSNGHKLLVNMMASPVALNGKIIGTITILRDVTKEKEVDRMKTEFISLASHQLRTPLSAIKWFTEMLLSGDAGKLKTEQQDFAHNIYDSTERMIQLVNSLLNISRIESGRIIIDPKPTDLKELVQGIVNDLKAKTAHKEQNLIISVHESLPKINVDARLIGQVYLNLLTNAIKYTPKKGDITVLISKKDDQIISQVSDTGYGIPKNQQGRIFQKFFRGDNIIKVETDGTGLGLYLIKAIIDSSGGKIWFESEEGKGTTFWFSLPVSGMIAKAGEVTLDG